MIKIFKELFFFSLLAVVIYFTLVVISGQFFPVPLSKNMIYKKSIGFTDLRFRQADKIRNVDILFLGSSLAYRGYDPRIFQKFGFKTFNLGTSSQSFVQTRFLIENYIDLLNPKFVVLDVYPRQFENKGIESSADIISNINLNFNILKMVFQQNDIRIYNTFIYSLYNQFIFNDNKYISPKLNTDTYIRGGYIENLSAQEKSKDIKKENIDVLPEQLNAFESIISIFKEKNIKFILVQSPQTINKKNSYINLNHFDSLFMEYGDYINFNQILDFEDQLFLDDNHLNQRGVNIYNNILLDSLRINSKYIFE